jgi:hypothetical protein
VQGYLSVCAIYLDEASYMREWIEFHRLVGVERFFLYDNESTDDHREVLAPYVAQGVVVVHEWPVKPGQMSAYQHCLAKHGGESRWIAFIDLDEFLFSPTLRPVPEILTDFEQYPAVAVNWAMFGSSGHRTRPPGLAIESYERRKRYPPDSTEHVKCIVDPRRAIRCTGPHTFDYDEGIAVNEAHRPLDKRPFSFSGPVSFELLRINHYARRSDEQFRSKLARGRAGGPGLKSFPEQHHERREAKLNAVRDDTIKAYLPALREALRVGERGAGELGAAARR